MARRYLSFIIFHLSLSAALVSCGDFWTADTANIADGRQMGLGRRVVTIVEGERYAIPVWFTPDTLYNPTVYWETEDDDIAAFDNDTLIALTPGVTRAIATSTIDRLSDTCWVQVLPRPEVDWGNFPYEMMLYASVTIHGTPLTPANQDSVIIAAYVDRDLRGVGQLRQSHGIDYLQMRIGSYRQRGDTVRLRCYYRGEARADWFPDAIVFDGEALGTLSDLYPLVIDSSSMPYEPDIEDFTDENPIYEDPDTVIIEINPINR